MKYRSYNRELRTATAQLLDVLNNITIDRRDNENTVQQLISVPSVYGNRSRILKSLENRNKTLVTPLIAISMESFRRDTERVHGIHDGLMLQTREWQFNPLMNTPIPVSITYTMDVITKYHEDMDQILCNFIPFTNPDFYVVWPHPKYLNINLKSQIIWDENVNISSPNEIAETDPYRFIATTTFTYKTWIFPGLTSVNDPFGDGPLIHRINFCPNMLSIEDGNYMLDRWYHVPTHISMDEYRQNIVCGLIKADRGRTNWDFLPMSGGVSGYWSDISASVSGIALGTHISGNPCFLTTSEGSILLVNSIGYLPKGMSEVDYYNYYLETISGSLSGLGC